MFSRFSQFTIILSLLLVADSQGQMTFNLDHMRVKQVIDNSTAIVTSRSDLILGEEVDFWYVGDAAQWVDGDFTRTSRYVIVDGTHRFETVTSSARTIQKLRDMTEEEIKARQLDPISISRYPLPSFFSGNIKVIQVLESSAHIGLMIANEEHKMIYKGSVDGWYDGESRSLDKAKIHGVHRYSSASGSTRTVRVIQDATDAEWEQHLQEQKAENLKREREQTAKLAAEKGAMEANEKKMESALQSWKGIQKQIGLVKHKDKTTIAKNATIVAFLDAECKDEGLTWLKANPEIERNHVIFKSKDLDSHYVAVSVEVLEKSLISKLKPSFEKAIKIQDETGVSFVVAAGIKEIVVDEVIFPDKADLKDSNWARKSQNRGRDGG